MPIRTLVTKLSTDARDVPYNLRLRFYATTITLNSITIMIGGENRKQILDSISPTTRSIAIPCMNLLDDRGNIRKTGILGDIGINTTLQRAANAFSKEFDRSLQAFIQTVNDNKKEDSHERLCLRQTLYCNKSSTTSTLLPHSS